MPSKDFLLEWDTGSHNEIFKGKDWRDDSVTKSTFVVFAEDPDSQYPWWLTTTHNSSSGDPTPFDFYRHQTHMWNTHIHTGKRFTHMKRSFQGILGS